MTSLLKTVFISLSLFHTAFGDARQCAVQSCNKEGNECSARGCSIINPDPSKKAPSRGKMVSCQTCRLMHYESLKKWLKIDQKWKEWQNLEMQWIQGHDPMFFIQDENGDDIERIDMTEYNYDEIPALLRRKGFRLKGEIW